MFKSNTNLPLSGKFASWLAIFLGLASILLPYMSESYQSKPSPYLFELTSVVFGLISIYAARHALNDKVWAFWLLLTLYLIQSVEYFSPGFNFSFIGPLSIKFGWRWVEPSKWLNFNVIGLIVVIIANNNITRHRIAAESSSSPRVA